MDVWILEDLFNSVDWTDKTFNVTLLAVAFNPLFWNLVARWEHRTKSLSRLLGSPTTACYSLAAIILLLNVYRSHSFSEAMKTQPMVTALDNAVAFYAGLGLLLLGTLLVVSSYLALGFFGTFLGDYFGILMKAKVTTFPFNIMENPMYWGSSLTYLGWAVVHASPAGLVLTIWVMAVYKVAIMIEGPFTAEIYRQRQKTAM